MKRGIGTGSTGATRLRLAGVGVAVAVLVALAAGRADAGSVYVHSARSGEFAGGRLTLHGVGRTVTWVMSGAGTGVAPIGLVRKQLFSRKGSATAVLGISGPPRARKFALRLSGLRYSAARGTVSYRARRLTKRTGAARAGAAVPRRFGAASLSVVPGSSLGGSGLGTPPPGASPVGSGGNGGNDCATRFANLTDGEFNGPKAHGNPIQILSEQQWDTDNWDPNPPSDLIFPGSADVNFTSDGGWLRGCEQSTVWHFVPECFVDSGCGPSGTFTISVEWDWRWDGPRFSCTSSNPQFKCVDATGGGAWKLVPAL